MNIHHERHRLRRLLSDGQWHHRRDLKVNMNDRTVRAIVQAYPDEFISTQKGYCLFECAGDKDVNWAVANLRSMARKLTEHADVLEQAMYKRQYRVDKRFYHDQQGQLFV